ncbi:MAG: glycoside hydrolase family 32 protein [Verrucomicrobia bacterium]|nr:glycoside hydrolase family 32 protein [Cytophagales bacterium]
MYQSFFTYLFIFCWLNVSAQALFNEKYRPQFHHSPPRGWANDPNGLIFLKGEYHLFYQHYPKDTRWGPMHWGHAISKDLFSWQNMPVALYPDSLGYIFSGSIVHDKNNTLGLFADTENGLVAIFTHDQKGIEQQSLAYSHDSGKSWTKFAKNPVLPNIGIKDFRDPSVFWFEAEKKWVMAVALPAKQMVQFYESKNLRSWTLTGEFGKQGFAEPDCLWECPALVQLPIENSNQKKWVLLVSVGQNKFPGSMMQYFTGNFNGKTFTNENRPSLIQKLDEGTDFYAAIPFNNLPEKEGNTVIVGWLNNWLYADKIPTSNWRGMQSMPRQLSLNEAGQLLQKPVDEARKLRKNHFDFNETDVVSLNELLGKYQVIGNVAEIDITAENITGNFGIKILKGTNEETIIGYDTAKEILYFDRSKSGEIDFYDKFSEGLTVPFKLSKGELRLHIFIDKSAVEVFVNEGEKVLTFQVFPKEESKQLQFFGDNKVKINSFDFWQLENAGQKYGNNTLKK